MKVITEIIGRYIPTARNGLVRDHFEKLGFVQIDSSSEETTWRIGTGKSSLSKRSTSTCCGVSSDVIDDRGRLRHQLFRIAVLARAFRSRRYRSGIVTNLYAADKIEVASSA